MVDAIAEKTERPSAPAPITLFLAGDIMTGRGIDQTLPHPSSPELYEPVVKDARRYVELAERAHGKLELPLTPSYIWGDALAVLERAAPDARIANLETAVTTSDEAWPDKSIHYRMHPKNIGCLTVLGLDCVALANNHVLDWGYPGLAETLDVVRRAGIRVAGAGRTLKEAAAPAIVPIEGKGRVLVFGLGSPTSGIAPAWAAGEGRAGVHLLAREPMESLPAIRATIAATKRPGDVVVASIHWGGNWGYAVSSEQKTFAHALVAEAGVDVVHGHSSHHPIGIEVYEGRLIVYGAGDFYNDYEGIGGYEQFRGDLALMYLARVQPATGRLLGLDMVPFKLRRFRLERAAPGDAAWLAETLSRASEGLGTSVKVEEGGRLELVWKEAGD